MFRLKKIPKLAELVTRATVEWRPWRKHFKPYLVMRDYSWKQWFMMVTSC